MTILAVHARGAVTEAIRAAADATGIDFGYLLAQAKVESGLNPAAQARTSSARGLYQFTAGTWLDTVRKHGAAHGLGWAAEALRQGADKATRATILGLRDDARTAALMAAEFAADNRDRLEAKLGRAVGATDLYLAHFLGSGGAARFLAARDADPGGTAADAVSGAAARANQSVFTAAGGRPRSLGEVFDRFAAKLGNDLPAGGNVLPVRPVAVPATQAARMAYLLLAELGG